MGYGPDGTPPSYIRQPVVRFGYFGNVTIDRGI